MTDTELIQKVKVALTKYIRSEGCSCCRDLDKHEEAGDELGRLLNYPRYPDDSGVDWYSDEDTIEHHIDMKLEGKL